MAPFAAKFKRDSNTFDLLIAEEFAPPTLGAEVAVLGGMGTASPRLVRETLGAPVQMPLPVLFNESSHSSFTAKVDSLDAFLRLGTCTLEVTFTGASVATVWTVYHAQPVQPMFTRSADMANWVQATVTLLVDPFVTLAAVTLHNAQAVTAPSSLSLSAMTGNFRSPLTITSNSTSADTHSLYLAIDRDSYDDYLSDAADLTWGSGATDTSDVDARSGTGVYVKSLTAVSATIDTADCPEGPYLILARVKVKNGKIGYITTDYTDGVISFTRATWHIVELGTCYLPTRRVTGTAVASLTVSVYGSSASTGDEACIDWVYALPIGDGMFSWHPSTDTVDADIIARDAATATTYIDDVANEEHVTGNTLMALKGKLLIVAEEAAGTDPTQALAVTVSYVPRFAWMR